MTPEELQQKTYELDLQKFAFEKERQHKEQEFQAQKLASTKAIDADKLAVEKQKAKWSTIAVFVTGFSILASVIVGSLAIYESQKLQNQAADTQFALKAADLVLQSDDPEVNANKAARFQELFPQRVRWGVSFDWKKYAVENDDMKVALVKLLAEHPTQKDEIINLYKKLFQDDLLFKDSWGEFKRLPVIVSRLNR